MFVKKYLVSSLLVAANALVLDKPARIQHYMPTAPSRRNFLEQSSAALIVSLFPQTSWASSSLADSFRDIQQARRQMEQVPTLIQEQKWDAVRAILITPPLADCWAKTSRPLLKSYADQVGDSGGDELAAIELKEDLISHLRYLDMAVYNNVFNPINTMGENGATKALIKSYYEDPINEYKASVEALNGLLKLADQP